jgi:hypothetical protein
MADFLGVVYLLSLVSLKKEAYLESETLCAYRNIVQWAKPYIQMHCTRNIAYLQVTVKYTFFCNWDVVLELYSLVLLLGFKTMCSALNYITSRNYFCGYYISKFDNNEY